MRRVRWDGRRAAAARAAEDARRAEEARKAEEARRAEEARLAAEQAALKIGPFFIAMVGKQQRQYDAIDPADLGVASNPVNRFDDALVGIRGAYLGTGLTLWDFTHKDITTL